MVIMQLELFNDTSKRKSIQVVSTESLHVSSFNPRATRPEKHIEDLANRMQRNGFEITRALWARKNNEGYEVFAGGTRLEAARRANLAEVPIVVHEGFTDDDIVRLADEDNENDEYHASVPITDIWAEYWRLNKELGWTQQRIADAKEIDRTTVVQRIGWHERLPNITRKAVLDGTFDEGHISAIWGVVLDVQQLHPWLTTEQAQTELTKEILEKHRGSSAGIKPTVKNVRAAADEWKHTINTAIAYYNQLPADYQPRFVELLTQNKARTKPAIHQAMAMLTREREAEARQREEELARQQSEAEAERLRLQRETEKAQQIEQILASIKHGDARNLVDTCPQGVALILTDPPYGIDFQSSRRTTSAKAPKIANDKAIEEANELLFDVLVALYDKMNEHSTAFIWSSQEYEPDFRQTMKNAGFIWCGTYIWVKPNHGSGDLEGTFAPKHECIIHAVKGNPKLRKRHVSVLEGKEFLGTGHQNEKPCDLLRILITATTDEGDLIADPFAGSGSTVLSAYITGRTFWACEIEQQWYRAITNTLYERINGEVSCGRLL